MSADDGTQAFAEAMRALRESCRQAAAAMLQFELNLLYLCNEELRDWNDEMDNCYPNWPDD